MVFSLSFYLHLPDKNVLSGISTTPYIYCLMLLHSEQLNFYHNPILYKVMDTVLNFIRAAAPWLTIGILLIILAFRSLTKKNNAEGEDNNYGTEGMCLGMCLGTAFGTMLGNDTGIGISLGMLVGLAIGMGISKPNSRDK